MLVSVEKMLLKYQTLFVNYTYNTDNAISNNYVINCSLANTLPQGSLLFRFASEIKCQKSVPGVCLLCYDGSGFSSPDY